MHFKVSSAICFNLDQSKILLSVNELNLYHTIPTFNNPEKRNLLKTWWEKRENAGNQYFLLFPPYFLPIAKRISVFKLHIFCCLPVLSVSTMLKIYRSVIVNYLTIQNQGGRAITINRLRLHLKFTKPTTHTCLCASHQVSTAHDDRYGVFLYRGWLCVSRQLDIVSNDLSKIYLFKLERKPIVKLLVV